MAGLPFEDELRPLLHGAGGAESDAEGGGHHHHHRRYESATSTEEHAAAAGAAAAAAAVTAELEEEGVGLSHGDDRGGHNGSGVRGGGAGGGGGGDMLFFGDTASSNNGLHASWAELGPTGLYHGGRRPSHSVGPSEILAGLNFGLDPMSAGTDTAATGLSSGVGGIGSSAADGPGIGPAGAGLVGYEMERGTYRHAVPTLHDHAAPAGPFGGYPPERFGSAIDAPQPPPPPPLSHGDGNSYSFIRTGYLAAAAAATATTGSAEGVGIRATMLAPGSVVTRVPGTSPRLAPSPSPRLAPSPSPRLAPMQSPRTVPVNASSMPTTPGRGRASPRQSPSLSAKRLRGSSADAIPMLPAAIIPIPKPVTAAASPAHKASPSGSTDGVRPSPQLRPVFRDKDGTRVLPDADNLAKNSNYENVRSGSLEILGLTETSDVVAGVGMRRHNHKTAEQKRRDYQKYAFEALRSLLPGADSGINKIDILRKAYEYIGTLQHRLRTLEREYDLAPTVPPMSPPPFQEQFTPLSTPLQRPIPSTLSMNDDGAGVASSP